MFKRVIVLILLLSVFFVNCFPVLAYADFWDGLKYSVSSIWDGSFFLDPSGATVNYWKKLFGVGDEPVHDAESYNTYITNNYPATMYSSSGQYLYQIPISSFFNSGFKIGVMDSDGYQRDVDFSGIFTGSGVYTQNIDGRDFSVFVSLTSPYSVNISPAGDCVSVRRGQCILDYYYSSSFDVIDVYYGLMFNNTEYKNFYLFPSEHRLHFSMSSSLGDSVYSSISLISPVLLLKTIPETSTNFYVKNSRVGSITYNIVDAQMQNYYPNVQLFNEETNIYTNPSTGQLQSVQSWTYDYSTRTYHLTLDDGSLLDIEFGDGSIKVTLNGELTQEYYYTVEKEEEPGPTPTPQPGGPTPTPEPGGPTPTPEPGPEPEDPDGFFAWLKQWLIEFKEWLGDWLDKLFNKEPGDITIDDSDNSVHINDQDDLDYDIYYTDDTGEQRKTSLRDLLHKFDFLRDIYDIGRDLFSIVGADAAMAHAYNSSGSVDITPYLGDLRTVAAADVMPIAGGAGAPSLKMNLGAANSHYGFKYGGEVEILDLSWYTPYKATVDNLLSGFLWLFFVWRLFKHAPSIVSGAGMVTDKAEDIHDGKRH